MKFLGSIFLVPAGLCLLLGGCATAVDPSDTSLSMVFGYIDMTTAPVTLKEVLIRRYSRPTITLEAAVERNTWTERGGLFWHLGVEPGTYQIYSFGDGKDSYDYGDESQNGTAIRIEKPGLYFMGSYSYTIKPRKTPGPEEFYLTPTASQHEAELLERLIRVMESKKDDKVYVRQYGWLTKRLAELKR